MITTFRISYTGTLDEEFDEAISGIMEKRGYIRFASDNESEEHWIGFSIKNRESPRLYGAGTKWDGTCPLTDCHCPADK